MHAIRLHEFGAADHLVLEELPDLDPAPGQVRISVEASGVHLIDTSIRRGDPGPIDPPSLPTIPGREVAGVVDRLGDGVEESWIGRRVAAHLGPVPGGYADQAVTDIGNLVPVPSHVSFPDAIAAIGTGRTALGILELEPPNAGDTVLVPSAAGGLGWLLVQSALETGAQVVAAAGGPDRTATLDGLGATLVVDYTRHDWVEHVRTTLGDVSLVYDGVGGAVGRGGLELLRPGGRLVMFGFSSGTPTQLDTSDLVDRAISAGWTLGPRLFGLPGGIHRLATQALARVAEGEWQPLVTTYSLADAARAHLDLEQRKALGKVVLVSCVRRWGDGR